jgi:GT2 family glycosyltransferase
MKRIAVVIPNWNGQDVIARCIDSLLAQTIKPTIVVVENGSTDSSDEILASYGSKIVVLKQPKNLGFAGGVNVGIRYAIDNGLDYVALFNNDAVADTQWLEELAQTLASDESVGIATPKMLKADKKTLDAVGTEYSIYGAPFPRGRNEQDTGQYDEPSEVFGGAGGASMYRVSLLKEIGLFDEDFFAYYEEDDINFRAHLKGWRVMTAPKAVVYHDIGGTSGKIKGFTVQQTAQNFWFLYTKNMPGWLFWKYLPLASLWYFLMFVDRTRKGAFTYFIKGWFGSIRLFFKTLAKRRDIQKNRTITPKQASEFLYHAMPPKALRARK